VSDADEFRKQANDARQMAARSLKQEDKAFWLRLAEDWIKLAQEADKNSGRQDGQNSN
jgi:gluconate kinase